MFNSFGVSFQRPVCGSITPNIHGSITAVSDSQIPVCRRRLELRPGSVCRQLITLRVKLRQNLPGFNALTQFRLPLDDFSAYPKAQP